MDTGLVLWTAGVDSGSKIVDSIGLHLSTAWRDRLRIGILWIFKVPKIHEFLLTLKLLIYC